MKTQISVVFLIYKKDPSKFSVELLEDGFSSMKFKCPITEEEDFEAYCDFIENYGHAGDTKFFEIVNKTFEVLITPEGIK